VREAVFLSLEECIRLHEEQIRRFGGSAGLRDPGLLESALARPRSGYYKTLFEQAAALLQNLAMNHCFVDGNKRMAMGCAFIFLDWNGFEINADGEKAERFLIEKVIMGKADVGGISKWLADHASPLTSNETAAIPSQTRKTAPASKAPGKRPSTTPAKPTRRKSR
jgi:death on curing protein